MRNTRDDGGPTAAALAASGLSACAGSTTRARRQRHAGRTDRATPPRPVVNPSDKKGGTLQVRPRDDWDPSTPVTRTTASRGTSCATTAVSS